MNIRSQCGSSLIELMVAVVVLGAVTLGFTTMISQVMNQQKIAQARQDLADVGLEVQTIFSNPDYCKSSLAGAAFDASKAAVAYDASKPFAFNGMPFKLKINGSDTLQGNTDLKNYNLSVKHFQIVNASPAGTDSAGNDIYTAQVIGHFGPKNYSGSGVSDFAIRNMSSGYLTVNGNTVVGCSSASPPTQTTALANCQSLGGSFDTASGKCAVQADPASTCATVGGTYASGKCTLPSSGSTSAGSGSSGSGTWQTTGVTGSPLYCSGSPKGSLEGQSCPQIASTTTSANSNCNFTYTCVGSGGGAGSTTSASSAPPANNAAIANDPAFMGALCANFGGTASGTTCTLASSGSSGPGAPTTGTWAMTYAAPSCISSVSPKNPCSPIGTVQNTNGRIGGIGVSCLVTYTCQ